LDTLIRPKLRAEIVSNFLPWRVSRLSFAVEYNMYMQLGVAGLLALENYNLEDHVCSSEPSPRLS
jgi:hypothetical protein